MLKTATVYIDVDSIKDRISKQYRDSEFLITKALVSDDAQSIEIKLFLTNGKDNVNTKLNEVNNKITKMEYIILNGDFTNLKYFKALEREVELLKEKQEILNEQRLKLLG